MKTLNEKEYKNGLGLEVGSCILSGVEFLLQIDHSVNLCYDNVNLCYI